jgi:hypothetical protein
MPEGHPGPETSARGDADEHRFGLKDKAADISRSLSDFFLYLTPSTKSLEESIQSK